MRGIRFFVLFALNLSLASGAAATDGVLEINQTCATKTGCFEGDDAGFPVTISSPGSYRLTSSLNVTKTSLSSIEVTVDDVNLDLNGFRLTVCVGVICGLGDPAPAIDANGAERARISNGTIRGATGYGIITGAGAELRSLLVEDCKNGLLANLNSRVLDVTVRGSAGYGIVMGRGVLLARSTIVDSGTAAVRMSSNALVFDSVIMNNPVAFEFSSVTTTTAGGYRGCLITENGEEETQPIDAKMIDLGGNVCGSDTVCP